MEYLAKRCGRIVGRRATAYALQPGTQWRRIRGAVLGCGSIDGLRSDDWYRRPQFAWIVEAWGVEHGRA